MSIKSVNQNEILLILVNFFYESKVEISFKIGYLFNK